MQVAIVGQKEHDLVDFGCGAYPKSETPGSANPRGLKNSAIAQGMRVAHSIKEQV